MQTKGEKELQLQKVIGKNLKVARQNVARMTMQKVMQEIWGIEDRKNRLSEIENGSRMPSPYILLRLSMLYGVSLDFIYGVSHDIERDAITSRAGMVVQGLRETALDLVDKIGMMLAKQVSVMPRIEAINLLDAAKQMVFEFKRVCSTSPDFVEKFEEMADCMEAVENACKQLENAVARHFRIMELTIYDHIERTDKEITSEYLTDHRVLLDQPIEAERINLESA